MVARSQHDPLYGDSEESQNLLQSNQPGGALDRDTQVKEQIKYGIFFDDDYDYLQHLKKPEMVVMEPVIAPGQGDDDQGTVEEPELPTRSFGRDIELEEKMFPARAPQLDWDPDIVDALKTAEATSDPQEELEDDFILLANEGQSAVPVYVTEIDDEVTPWWQTRGDFHTAQCPEGSGSSNESDEDDDNETEEEMEEDDDRPAGLTECSLSSSVVPRSEVLTLLDNRFEKLMEEYNDENIGNLADDMDDAMPTEGDQWLIQSAVQDFEDNFTFNTQSLEKKVGEGVTGTRGMIDEDTETEDETELVEVDDEQGHQWDCESILSTYSTLYNHPTKIKELPGPRSLSKKMDVSLKTTKPETQENHEQHKDGSKAIIHRPKEESKEDKTARKKLLKEVKKERRVQKKATKIAFKTEELRMEKVMVSQRNTKPVV